MRGGSLKGLGDLLKWRYKLTAVSSHKLMSGDRLFQLNNLKRKIVDELFSSGRVLIRKLKRMQKFPSYDIIKVKKFVFRLLVRP